MTTTKEESFTCRVDPTSSARRSSRVKSRAARVSACDTRKTHRTRRGERRRHPPPRAVIRLLYTSHAPCGEARVAAGARRGAGGFIRLKARTSGYRSPVLSHQLPPSSSQHLFLFLSLSLGCLLLQPLAQAAELSPAVSDSCGITKAAERF